MTKNSSSITQEIKTKLCGIFSQVLERPLTEADFPEGPGLLEKLHIDSLIALKIIVKIEQIFNVVIEDDDAVIEILDDFGKAVNFIASASIENTVFMN
jgi:acyl carrier protein